jgi:hypothetical protein
MATSETNSPVKIVADAANTINETFGDIIKTSSNSFSNLARRILSFSATTLSVAFAGVVGFVIFRSYKSHNYLTCDHINSFDLTDPDLSKIKKQKEQIEEVGLFSVVTIIF